MLPSALPLRLSLFAGLQATAVVGVRPLVQVLSLILVASLFAFAVKHRHWGQAA